MEKDNTILVKCKYCGCEFTTDSRHPQACCCGSLECRRAAAREHSKRHCQSLKSLYASREGRSDPYHRMLDRKKAERRKRQAAASCPLFSARPRTAPPRIRPVSTALLFSVLEMLFAFIGGMSDPEENRRCLLHNLQRMPTLRDSPEHLAEMRNFIGQFQARFPHICPSPHGGVPHVRSTDPH